MFKSILAFCSVTKLASLPRPCSSAWVTVRPIVFWYLSTAAVSETDVPEDLTLNPRSVPVGRDSVMENDRSCDVEAGLSIRLEMSYEARKAGS
ncbi:hypothetical protein R80B4_02226 [Fibrobacteres bacterium R8-0-B4]